MRKFKKAVKNRLISDEQLAHEELVTRTRSAWQRATLLAGGAILAGSPFAGIALASDQAADLDVHGGNASVTNATDDILWAVDVPADEEPDDADIDTDISDGPVDDSADATGHVDDDVDANMDDATADVSENVNPNDDKDNDPDDGNAGIGNDDTGILDDVDGTANGDTDGTGNDDTDGTGNPNDDSGNDDTDDTVGTPGGDENDDTDDTVGTPGGDENDDTGGDDESVGGVDTGDDDDDDSDGILDVDESDSDVDGLIDDNDDDDDNDGILDNAENGNSDSGDSDGDGVFNDTDSDDDNDGLADNDDTAPNTSDNNGDGAIDDGDDGDDSDDQGVAGVSIISPNIVSPTAEGQASNVADSLGGGLTGADVLGMTTNEILQTGAAAGVSASDLQTTAPILFASRGQSFESGVGGVGASPTMLPSTGGAALPLGALAAASGFFVAAGAFIRRRLGQ